MASFLCSGALSGSMVKASLGVSAVGYFVNILFLRRVRVGGLVAVQQSKIFLTVGCCGKNIIRTATAGDG